MAGVLCWISAGLVLYTYLGYPLAVLALSRLRRPPSFPVDHLPRLSLIIAACDEEAVIASKVEESLGLDYPPDRLQIIVAADGSRDTTAQRARRYEDRDVEVLWQAERRGKMAALNRAMGRATGEVVVFSDANCSYRSDALRQMAAPFADATVGVVSGRKTVAGSDGLGYSEGLYWRYESAIRQAETRLGSTLGVNGEILAIRRSLFSSAPSWVVNDDAWMAMEALKAGYRVIYNHRAVSVEQVSATAAEERERRTRMIAGNLQQYSRVSSYPWRRPIILWQLISHKLLRRVVPFGMLGAFCAASLAVAAPPEGEGWAGLASLAPPFGAIVLGLQIVFYLLAFAGNRLSGLLGHVAYVPRFLVDSNVAQVRGIIRHLRGGQSPVWVKASRETDRVTT